MRGRSPFLKWLATRKNSKGLHSVTCSMCDPDSRLQDTGTQGCVFEQLPPSGFRDAVVQHGGLIGSLRIYVSSAPIILRSLPVMASGVLTAGPTVHQRQLSTSARDKPACLLPEGRPVNGSSGFRFWQRCEGSVVLPSLRAWTLDDFVP